MKHNNLTLLTKISGSISSTSQTTIPTKVKKMSQVISCQLQQMQNLKRPALLDITIIEKMLYQDPLGPMYTKR